MWDVGAYLVAQAVLPARVYAEVVEDPDERCRCGIVAVSISVVTSGLKKVAPYPVAMIIRRLSTSSSSLKTLLSMSRRKMSLCPPVIFSSFFRSSTKPAQMRWPRSIASFKRFCDAPGISLNDHHGRNIAVAKKITFMPNFVDRKSVV